MNILHFRSPWRNGMDPGDNENTYFSADMSLIQFGTLNYICMGSFTLLANHGLNFEQAGTV